MNSEPKKAAALRKELAETSDMLLWLLRRIDEHNDDSEPPFCPKPDMECRGNCRGCWFSAALDYARRYAHG